MHDLKNNVDLVQSLAPAARTASADGTAADLRGYDSVIALVEFGLWTDGTHTPVLEESDDNVTFTAVASANQQGVFTVCSSAATDNLVQRVGYLGTKRYIRIALTIAGTTDGAVSSAVIVRGHPVSAPVA